MPGVIYLGHRCSRAGCVVDINPLYTPHELEHQMKDSGAKAIDGAGVRVAECDQAEAA